ncbi:SDR family oxidoreductase [soil metagenome]
MSDSIVLLGVGNVAFHLAKLLANRCTIFGTTRSADRVPLLEAVGIQPIIVDAEPLPKQLLTDANILVSFPPDGSTDSIWSAQCTVGKRVVYISSTGVYGKTKGVITEDSPVDVEDPRAAKRLEAENIWRARGATILRCPGLYAAETGMHLRISHLKIPGDGTSYVSRIHLDDLARIIVACFEKTAGSSTYVVGDLKPSTHLETITWLCERMGIELPGFADLSEVSPTLRGNRQIDSSKLLKELNITLQYPTYRDGYGAILDALAS